MGYLLLTSLALFFSFLQYRGLGTGGSCIELRRKTVIVNSMDFGKIRELEKKSHMTDGNQCFKFLSYSRIHVYLLTFMYDGGLTAFVL